MKSSFANANDLLRSGEYDKAIEYYAIALSENQGIKGMIVSNTLLALSRKGLEATEEKALLTLESYRPTSHSEIPGNNISELYAKSFDVDYYLSNYPDVVVCGVDPFTHYSNWGWRERRRPNEWFDSNFYIEKYQNLLNTEEDPFLDYLKIGRFEGRVTKDTEHQIFNALDKSYANSNIERIGIDEELNGYVGHNDSARVESKLKAIAFFLPQFHPFEENDKWWGKGFTEWYNVTRAQRNFVGHYQPHLPIHNGFYDLRVPEVLREQAKLARDYGIYGFNFYYYWFDGKVLMHRPFEILLNNPDIDIKYCLTWANENWTRRWDGAENDVLISQNHCEEDSYKFIHHVTRYFRDERYITVDGKPVLIVYRANIIPDMAKTIELWRREVRSLGFSDIYLVAAQTFGLKDPVPLGFDAAMEFPPHTVKSGKINDLVDIINPEYEGNIFDYRQVVVNSCRDSEPDYKRFRTVMLSWDNTARKQNQSHTFANFSVSRYKLWLSHISQNVIDNVKYSQDEKFVFINAWNEWAEGTHLEPDRCHGYAYLEATKRVVNKFETRILNEFSLNPSVGPRSKYAVVLHLHYCDLWGSISGFLDNFGEIAFDLYVTLDSSDIDVVKKIKMKYPNSQVILVENRGRDIRPFIDVYRKIKTFGYNAVCKIHSKKSIYRQDGDKLREDFLSSLLGTPEIVANIISKFESPRLKVGICAPASYIVPHTDKNLTFDREVMLALCDHLGLRFSMSKFPAGSMYWFKPEAFSGIDAIQDHWFGVEEGLVDGTLAHAFERLVTCVVESNGYIVDSI